MALNPAYLVWNGVTSESETAFVSFNGRYQWEYTDTSSLLVDITQGAGAVSTDVEIWSRLRDGDFVLVTGSDGQALCSVRIYQPNSVDGNVSIRALFATTTGFNTEWWK